MHRLVHTRVRAPVLGVAQQVEIHEGQLRSTVDLQDRQLVGLGGVFLHLASLSSGMTSVMVTIVVFFVFSSPTFLTIRSLSTVSNSNHLLVFSIRRSSPIALSIFLASSFPPLSGHLISLPVFHLPSCPCDRPISIYSSPISSQNLSLIQTSTLSSSIFLLSALLTPTMVMDTRTSVVLKLTLLTSCPCHF